jgi:hypothetical protein
MEDKTNLLDSLLESATDYGITSFELIKLKALDKSTDIISSLIPFSFFILLIASFLLFLNLGIALWLGELLGKLYYGFFLVAGFYILAVIIIRFFLYEWIKKLVGNYFVKQMLK